MMKELNYSFFQQLSPLQLGTFICLNIFVRIKSRFNLFNTYFSPKKFKSIDTFKNANKVHLFFLDIWT